MKKAAVVTLILIATLGVFTLLLWDDIMATAVLMRAKNTIPAEQHSLTIAQRELATSTLETSEVLSIGSINVPIPFVITERSEESNYFRVIAADQSVLAVLNDIEMRDAFFANENLSPEQATAMCQFLQEGYGPDVCASNFAFFTALLEVNMDTPSLFSSKTEKLSTAVLGIMRSLFLASTEASGLERFSTGSIQGYAGKSMNGDVVVTLFAPDDTQYTLISNLDDQTIDAVLQSITTSTE